TTAANARPGEATMSPETFSIRTDERGPSVALKRSVRVAVKFSSAPARAAAGKSSIPRPSRIHRLSQSERLLPEEKPRSRVSLFITRRDATLLMKFLDPPVPRLSTLNSQLLQNSIAFSADAAFVRTKP